MGDDRWGHGVHLSAAGARGEQVWVPSLCGGVTCVRRRRLGHAQVRGREALGRGRAGLGQQAGRGEAGVGWAGLLASFAYFLILFLFPFIFLFLFLFLFLLLFLCLFLFLCHVYL